MPVYDSGELVYLFMAQVTRLPVYSTGELMYLFMAQVN